MVAICYDLKSFLSKLNTLKYLSKKKGTFTNRIENCRVTKIFSSSAMRTSRLRTNF